MIPNAAGPDFCDGPGFPKWARLADVLADLKPNRTIGAEPVVADWEVAR